MGPKRASASEWAVRGNVVFEHLHFGGSIYRSLNFSMSGVAGAMLTSLLFVTIIIPSVSPLLLRRLPELYAFSEVHTVCHTVKSTRYEYIVQMNPSSGLQRSLSDSCVFILIYWTSLSQTP